MQPTMASTPRWLWLSEEGTRAPGWPRNGRSAAGHAHMSGQSGALVTAVDDEVVALGLPCDGVVDRGVEGVVGLRRAERRPEIRGILLAEAHIERAGAGDADAVAGFAEVVCHRRDEAEPPAGLLDADVAGRA